ncbi:ArsR/SmtB family transcription factor [Natronoglycomyces albus]|uniref:Winged helix-turn-helix transcriptional regulator n=1 Tax=Natronoglycomyces albus TaxID=2811108 RepID=A0A895XJW6_9ACTN|nr:metalloregulator ArsR/SmtB family transcription factor [Natronoglycomyces albus]QSB06051.1 winged helix-turn-helix transcriptional regulator [Natronoglycomyces albus]
MNSDDNKFSPHLQRFMKALASQTRQDVMFLFNDREELTVTDVANRLSLAQSAASVHLSTLREAGILTSRREWKAVYYQVNPDGIFNNLDELRDYLMACCPPDAAQPEDETQPAQAHDCGCHS